MITPRPACIAHISRKSYLRRTLMKRFSTFFALVVFLSVLYVFAQENPQQTPAVPDSTKPGAAVRIESGTLPPDSGAAQKEKPTVPPERDSDHLSSVAVILAAILGPLVVFLL